MERKLAAILSADVQGYSRLMGDDEEATIQTLTAYRESMAGLIRQHHGRVVDSPGDNLLAEFASAVDAVQGAVAIQEELATRNTELSENRQMHYRIGINVGDVVTEGERIYGDGVNIAARLESLAEGGGICISGNVHEQVKNKLALGYKYQGEQTVKNIADPVRVYHITPDKDDAAEARPNESADSPLVAVQSKQRMSGMRWAAALAVIVPLAFLTWWLIPQNETVEPIAGPAVMSQPAESPEPSRKHIAVLPFENLGSPEQEYFAAGMTEEITSRLAGVHGLGVTSRTTVLQYKQTDKTMRQIGAELGVGYILEGTVRWAQNSDGTSRVRITPQLIRVADDTHMWADSYDRVIEDIFAVQSEIAENVLSQLDITLLDSERSAVQGRGTQNLDAYDAYLRGGEYLLHAREVYSTQDAQIAEDFFNSAIKLDPNFALAHAKLAEIQAFMYQYYLDRSERRLDLLKEYAQQAVKLAPDLPEGHLALGYYFRARFETEFALREFELARQGRPGDSNIVHAIAMLQWWSGQMLDEAIVSYQLAAALAPRRGEFHCQLGGVHRTRGEFQQAENAHLRAISIRPDRSCPKFCMAFIYLHWQGPERARTFLESLPSTVGLEEYQPINYGWIMLDLIAGDYEVALQRLESGTAEVYQGMFYYPKALLKAHIYALLGRFDQAQQAYDKARGHLEAKLEKRFGDPHLHSALGLAYAGLGREADAIREGRRAVELYPEGADIFFLPYRLKDLAQIYVMLGDHEAALDALELLLSSPSMIHLPEIQLDPTWASLHGHPRFLKLRKHTETIETHAQHGSG